MTTPEIYRSDARPPHDAESEVAAVVVGGGVLLTQAFALFPGLLPFLLLLLPFVLPLIVLGILAAVLVGVPYGIWRLIAKAVHPRRSLPDRESRQWSPGRPATDR